MQKKLKILYISSEIAPFVKTSPMADVAEALPKVLKNMDCDIRLFIPKYGIINERKYTLREVIRLKEIKVPQGDKTVIASVKSAFLPDSKIQVYFVENKDYFDRSELYFDPKTNDEWEDNAERFIFFSRSIFEILKVLHWQPDIIHCNDWQTALIPFFLKTIYNEDPFFHKTLTLLSIHNLAMQGIYDKKVLSHIGHPNDFFYPNSAIEFKGKINFLKAGIIYADLINTVSNNYAKEIQTSEEYGFGLQGIFRKRSKHLYGIVNGIDYSVWNPEIDQFIPYNYSRKEIAGKLENKRVLVESQGLKFNENIPVIGTISLLTDHKGFDLLIAIFDDLMKMKIQYILLGEGGDEKYLKLFQSFVKKYPNKMAINLGFDDQLSHLIEAGCDIFLVPSRVEPWGTKQLYSLKYGTIPIVYATGSLVDTVKNFNPETKRGYGFVLNNYSSEALLDAISQAVKLFHDKDAWKKLVDRAMKQDFSWYVAAENYRELYYKLLK